MNKYLHKRRGKQSSSATAANEDWRLWCRLCAKDDVAACRDIFMEQVYETGNDERIKLEDDDSGSFLNVAAVIEKFYAVKIDNDIDLPRILCDDCYEQINALIAFGYRLTRVQKMFDELQTADQANNMEMDFDEARLKYGVPKQCTNTSNIEEAAVDDNCRRKRTANNNAEVESKPTTIEIEHLAAEYLGDEEEDFVLNKNQQDNDYLQEKLEKCESEIEFILEEDEEMCSSNEENCPKQPNSNNTGKRKTSNIKTNNINLYECAECERTFRTLSDLRKHTKMHNPNELRLKIEKCDNSADDNDDSTVEFSNDDDDQDEDYRPDKDSTDRRTLAKLEYGTEDEDDMSILADSHESNDDNPLKTTNIKDRVAPKKRKPQSKPKYWMSCTECSSKFTRLTYYSKHMKAKHNKTVEQPTINCPDCDRVFRQYHELVRHSQKHVPVELRRVVNCPHCSIKLACKASLNTHIRFVHLNERNYVCNECGASFARGHALKTHMLLHSGLSPYVCEVCNKGFKEKSKLRLHMDVHNSNKHICPECGVLLNSRYTLRDHMTIHSDETPFKCEYCGRAFKRRIKLKFHLLRHVGLKPYSCNYCEEAFVTSADCVLHLKKEHQAEYVAIKESGSGDKGYTSNMPTLTELRAITQVATDLKPVANRRQNPSAYSMNHNRKKEEDIQ